MKTQGINIVRLKRVLNNKGEEVLKRGFFTCRINAAVPNNHHMITSEQSD